MDVALAGFFDVKDLVDMVKQGGAGVTIVSLAYAVYRLWEQNKAHLAQIATLHAEMQAKAEAHHTQRQKDFEAHAAEVQRLLESNHQALTTAATSERTREIARIEAHQKELKERDQEHRAAFDRMQAMRVEEMETFSRGVTALVESAGRVQGRKAGK